MAINYTKALKQAKNAIEANSSLIVSGMAVSGVFTTAYLTWRAANQDRSIQEELGRPYEDYRERFSYAWRVYLPPVLSGTLTVCSIVLAQRINTRKQTALAGAYAVSERLLSDYRDEIEESLGQEKADRIHDKVAERHIIDDTKSKQVDVGEGKQLCYDDLTGRYFESNMEEIKAARNEANRIIFSDGFMSLNEFNSLLDLPYVSLGEGIGWSEMDQVDLYFTSHVTKDGRTALSVMHRNMPKLGRYYR